MISIKPGDWVWWYDDGHIVGRVEAVAGDTVSVNYINAHGRQEWAEVERRRLKFVVF